MAFADYRLKLSSSESWYHVPRIVPQIHKSLTVSLHDKLTYPASAAPHAEQSLADRTWSVGPSTKLIDLVPIVVRKKQANVQGLLGNNPAVKASGLHVMHGWTPCEQPASLMHPLCAEWLKCLCGLEILLCY